MSETMTQRALRKMLHPKPDTRLAEAREVIDMQAETIEKQHIRIRAQSDTIEKQRAHINAQDARIEKLQREVGGLHDLLW